jgi:TonB family protein
VTVDGPGEAADAQLEKSSGYPALDAATLKHVKGCAFEPKTTNGVPAIYKTRFSLHWELWT